MTVIQSEFIGSWRIERVIEDALSNSTAQFTGDAHIGDCGVDWTYSEIGKLILDGSPQMTAERSYIWRPDATGFDIFFNDERFFHRLELGTNPQAAHWCDPDQYDVRYDFSDWPNWSCVWNVRGPKKNYRMKSAYFLSV